MEAPDPLRAVHPVTDAVWRTEEGAYAITNAMLTNALKELEADGLVHREPYSEIPPRVEYTLTPKGRDLLPVFYAICQWGMKYIP